MAKKRMFSRDIVQSDAFLSMPVSSQLLYFQLGMVADDDGFVGNVLAIQRMVGCNSDDITLLVARRFLIQFPDGVFVIKHWRINNNSINLSHYKPTEYQEDLQSLMIKNNKAYTLDKDQGRPAADKVLLVDENGEIAKSLTIKAIKKSC